MIGLIWFLRIYIISYLLSHIHFELIFVSYVFYVCMMYANPYHKYGSRNFFTIDRITFVLWFIFEINRHSIKQFGEQWAGCDDVS